MGENFRDVTVVLQGPVVRTPRSADEVAIEQTLASIRAHLPGARVVLSTWAGTATEDLAVDDVVLSPDPGAQGPLKKGGAHLNNANRQILSTAAGLARVTTGYAVKMRTDSFLTGRGFVAAARAFPARDRARAIFGERVVSLRFFCVNPRAIQPTPFHLGDCFQFGRTEDLEFLWGGGPVSDADARWFVDRPHARGVPRKVRVFNTRFAVEQHVLLSAAGARLGAGCDSIDDASPESIRRSEVFFANDVIVVDPESAGVVMPKHQHMMNSLQEDYNCYSHLDWLDLYRRFAGGTVDAATRRAIRRRAWSRAVYAWVRRREWVAAVLEAPRLRRAWGSLFDRCLRPGNKRV